LAPPAVLEFPPEDRSTVLGVMAELAGRRGGWINLQPAVDPEDVPQQGTFRLFSPQGPLVPLCTWTPPDDKPRGPKYVSIGIQHGAGTKAVNFLKQYDVTVDPRWRVLTDAPKRGLVIAVPPDDPNDTVLGWLLTAGAALCQLPYSRWRAAVYRPR
jgi:hypothetical protein